MPTFSFPPDVAGAIKQLPLLVQKQIYFILERIAKNRFKAIVDFGARKVSNKKNTYIFPLLDDYYMVVSHDSDFYLIYEVGIGKDF